MAADTSSSAAGSNPVVGPAAVELAVLIAEPMFPTSVAAAANVSGVVSTYDISPSFPNDRRFSRQSWMTQQTWPRGDPEYQQSIERSPREVRRFSPVGVPEIMD
jgi:hypothetical protein